MAASKVAIISAVRTAVGKFQGSLQTFTAPQLGALVVREAVRRAGVKPAQVDDCIMGCVLQAGLGQNPARQAAIYGGLPPEVGALTVNQVCGSGLRAVSLASQAIETGDAQIVVAGGMESMSNAPYLLPQARTGYRMGNSTIVDVMINDGLWDVYNDFHMGSAAEMVASKYGITREDQDAFAAESHRRAAAATADGRFRDEILAVDLPPAKKGEGPRRFDADEAVRPGTSVEVLARLKPAFHGRRDCHSRECPGYKRWRRGRGGYKRGAGKRTRNYTLGNYLRAGYGRSRAGMVQPRPDRCHSQGARKSRVVGGNCRSLRTQRGVQRSGSRCHSGTRPRPSARQRKWRSSGDRASNRSQRRPGAGDAVVCHGSTRSKAWGCRAVSRRGECGGTRGGTAVVPYGRGSVPLRIASNHEGRLSGHPLASWQKCPESNTSLCNRSVSRQRMVEVVGITCLFSEIKRRLLLAWEVLLDWRDGYCTP